MFGCVDSPTESTEFTDCLGAFKGVHLSPLGFAACQSNKGNTLIIRLLPLQGVGLVLGIFTQGAALGYVLLPLRGVTLASFDTP